MDFNVALSIYHIFAVFGHGLVRLSDIFYLNITVSILLLSFMSILAHYQFSVVDRHVRNYIVAIVIFVDWTKT